jgi:5-methylthioadenosine/S-adenosylhomocysteine deaminase
MPRRLIIEGGTLLPLTDKREVLQDATVIVEDGVIAEITRQKHYAVRTLDARERLVMPGLVNAHTHLYQVLLRGMWDDIPLIPWLKNIYGAGGVLQPEDFHTGGVLGCVESIASGVTTVCDHFFLNRTHEQIQACIDGMKASGVRAVVARAIMDAGKLPPPCVKEEPADALAHVEQLLKRYADDLSSGMLRLMVGPNTPPLNASSGLIKQVVDFAKKNQIGISTHVGESREIVEQCKDECGLGVVEYLDALGLVRPDAIMAHCVHISPAEIEILAARGASVAHNPVSNCMLGDGIAPVSEMVAAGVNVALGTDGAASNHTQDMFEVMKTTSLLQRVRTGRPDVLDPYDILRMATYNGAKALGLGDKIGTIEVGKRADIILVNPFGAPHGVAMHNVLSHLVHTLKASDVETTIVDGEILMQERKFIFLDEKRIMRESQAQARDLITRIREYTQ